MDLQFGDIQETALVTLAIRASETARPNPRIVDKKAKEIIDTLGVDVSKYDPFLSHEGVVARTIMFANALRGLITQYPDAICVNLGCGFDDKFSQVDNGRIEWYDVDLPDQTAVRRKVFEDRPRCTMLDGDALDTGRDGVLLLRHKGGDQDAAPAGGGKAPRQLHQHPLGAAPVEGVDVKHQRSVFVHFPRASRASRSSRR